MHAPGLRPLMPILVAALLLWVMYRRVRRSFGRQPVHPVRLRLRIGLLSVVGAWLLYVSARELVPAAALLGGAAAGAALAFVGLRYTTFETSAQGRFYTPHTVVGVLVTALFVGRILFRILPGGTGPNGAVPADPDPWHAMTSNPVTLASFGIVLGYYLPYYAGVLRRSGRQPAPSDLPSGGDGLLG